MIAGLIGLAILCGAGGAYFIMQEYRPPRVIKVPVPAVPAPAPSQPPVFGPVPHVVVTSPPPPPPPPAPVVVEKPVVIEKRVEVVKQRVVVRNRPKSKTQRKLERRW